MWQADRTCKAARTHDGLRRLLHSRLQSDEDVKGGPAEARSGMEMSEENGAVR